MVNHTIVDTLLVTGTLGAVFIVKSYIPGRLKLIFRCSVANETVLTVSADELKTILNIKFVYEYWSRKIVENFYSISKNKRETILNVRSEYWSRKIL